MLRWFSWLSLLSISVVCIAASVLLSSFLTQHVLRHDASLTMAFLQSVADRQTAAARASGRQPDLKETNFEEFFQLVSGVRAILRANIFGRDGSLLWSSTEKLAEQKLSSNPELEKALAGDVVIEVGVAGDKDPKPEHVFLSDKPVRFVEIYMPIRNSGSGEVIGVAEIYREPRELFETIVRGTRLIWLLAALAGGLLFAVLLWIVRRADHTIEEQHQRLIESETLAAVGELGSAVAHGIRNPLASIRSSAELCADDKSCAACQSSLDIIDQVDHLERWVRNLLTYSHPDTGGPTTVALQPLIARVEEQFRRECGRRSIALSVDLPPVVPAVAAYEPLLEQVLCSLIANAVEAMPEGGELKVSVSLADDPKRVVLTVDDTGHGIAPEQLSKLFTPFATTKPRGMGLGLSLVRRIIHRFGGDVLVESQPKQGTRVKLDLIPAN